MVRAKNRKGQKGNGRYVTKKCQAFLEGTLLPSASYFWPPDWQWPGRSVKCPLPWRHCPWRRATRKIFPFSHLSGLWEVPNNGTQGPGPRSPTSSFLLFLCDWMTCTHWQLEWKWRNCSLSLKHYGKMTRKWNSLMRKPFSFITLSESYL